MAAIEEVKEKRATKVPKGATPCLSAALRELPGGVWAFIELFRQVKPEPEDDRAKVLAAWFEMQVTDKTRPEDVAEAAGISAAHLLGLISETLFTLQVPSAHIVRNANFSALMKKTMKFAGQKDGFRDREMIFKGMGEVPLPQGTIIHNHPMAIAGAGARADAAAAASTSGDTDAPDMESETLSFTDMLRGTEDDARVSAAPAKQVGAADQVSAPSLFPEVTVERAVTAVPAKQENEQRGK